MPTNFARRIDLFNNAGVENSGEVAGCLGELSDQYNLQQDSLQKVSGNLAKARKVWSGDLSPSILDLLLIAPEYLFDRGGDISNLFWLAHEASGSRDPSVMAKFALMLAYELERQGRSDDATGYMRFLLALEFDYATLYAEGSHNYGFFLAREPNPLVWKTLEFWANRERATFGEVMRKLSVVELGCGIGNDGLGFSTWEHLGSYTGIDLSEDALNSHAERAAKLKSGLTDREFDHRLLKGDFLTLLKSENLGQTNLVYSYSSLHYFNSKELAEIFFLVRNLLLKKEGLFVFGLKGTGSVWDGQGVPLKRPDVWINLDGQSRWFPEKGAVYKMAERYGFDILLHEVHEHWSYSETGRSDNFHYVICTPRVTWYPKGADNYQI